MIATATAGLTALTSNLTPPYPRGGAIRLLETEQVTGRAAHRHRLHVPIRKRDVVLPAVPRSRVPRRVERSRKRRVRPEPAIRDRVRIRHPPDPLLRVVPTFPSRH